VSGAVQQTPELVFDGPSDAARRIVLAHGAGAGMDTPFLNSFARGLSARGVRVIRFQFPYMSERRRDGVKRGPDPPAVLRAVWLRVIEAVGRDGLAIGGKSMGGRIASMLADETRIAALVCLGYPFHPVGKPNVLRVAHLERLVTPTLIVQGTRDPFGNRDEVAAYPLSKSIRIHWLDDGDHHFKPRKASGHTQEGHWQEAIAAVAEFLNSR
jgi:predicted alpha/beta-hydrolase family hydrolase